MKYYMVFGASSGKSIGHPEVKGLVWWSAPVGVFTANSADDACKTAAKKVERVGTFFAVEGRPWGISMVDTEGTTELGMEEDEETRLARMLRQSEERDAQIQKLLEQQNEEKYKQVTDELDDLEKQ